MIGYPITLTDLETLVENESPGWLALAAKRTAAFKKAGCYNEKKASWSAVKPVFMRLQGGCKCAYCERKLEAEPCGKGEQDVEHFRPKKNVRKWQPSKMLANAGVKVTAPESADGGYYLLAYHLFNYCAACKPCNSALKSDCFPIAGKYSTTGSDPAKLTIEKPLLIYPLGVFDDAPEKLIRFHGVSPQPVAQDGYQRHRALVTIEFFKLDDETRRKNLIRERAFIIVAMLPQLEKAKGTGPAASKARDLINAYLADTAPHANCSRSFHHLWESNPTEAERVADRAADYILSIS